MARALALVERVGGGIADAQARAGFFDGYAAFYCEGMLIAAREQHAEQVSELAQRYAAHAGKAGRAAAVQCLREYEEALPVRGDVSKEEIERNKAIVALLAGARKSLGKGSGK